MQNIGWLCPVVLVVALAANVSADEPAEAQPDSSLRLYVSSNHFGKQGLVAIDIPSMESQLIRPGSLLCPSCSPDGRRLICYTGTDAGARLVIVNADGSGEPVIIPTDHAAHSPSWSPDGARIAYVSEDSGGANVFASREIRVMTPDGRETENITQNADVDHSPTWSPDGQLIGFVSHRDGQFYMVISRPDGTEQRIVHELSVDAAGPSWSPDGQMIAYFRRIRIPSTLPVHVFVSRPDGSGERQVTAGDPEFQGFPAWSPDGRYIAYVRFEKWSNLDGERTGKLMLLDVVTEEHREVIDGVPRFMRGRPTWSPILGDN